MSYPTKGSDDEGIIPNHNSVLLEN
jgi:Na+/melibiose symporter-like transporter